LKRIFNKYVYQVIKKCKHLEKLKKNLKGLISPLNYSLHRHAFVDTQYIYFWIVGPTKYL